MELSIQLLYKMMLIREFENALSKAKMNNEIYGMVHCCNGQEAIAVGVCSALERRDYVVSTHRPHGHAIAKGVNLQRLLAEIYGKETGTNGGRGGSMHITDPSCGFMMSSGIVGAGIPLACGMAFSSKYVDEDKVTCGFIGDGAINEGSFYESLNLAAKWRLPILFVVEDNNLAVTTHTDDTSAVRDYVSLAGVFGIDATSIDGQDVQNVYNVAKTVIHDIRLQSKPFLLHAKTVRFQEHAEGKYYDDMKRTQYRDFDLLEREIHLKCPIVNYCNILFKNNIIDEKDYQNLLVQVKNEIKSAYDFMENSNEPTILNVCDI